jgi:hypothetical protein
VPPTPPPAPGTVSLDLGPVLGELRSLRVEVEQMRAAVATSPAEQGGTLVTGRELAASIEALGSALGNGMATLLTEHRNLLARDVDAAADRILEELAQRLRAGGSQTADAVEERLRLVTAKALGDLSEQVHLRLDQLQADVSGLRAVMLELPDQTAVSERLDHVVESVGTVRSLTTEIAALRRRISVRGEARGDGELSDAQLDDLADRVADRLRTGAAGPSAGGPVVVDDEPAEEAQPRHAAPAHRPARRRS